MLPGKSDYNLRVRKTPVTPVGRVVGIIFLFLATGIIVTMLGAVVSFITSEGIPLFFLNFQRKKNWYYFADCSPQSNILAANIFRQDPDAVIIFGEKQGAQSELPVEVYARTMSGQDDLSGNIHFFHSYECCARQYWHSKPLCKHEKVIVMIGFGCYGQSLLEWAILINVLAADQHVAYHIFGDEKEFFHIHYRLDTVFSLNEESREKDSLLFHKDFWGAHAEVLERADRIIICDDNESAGWDIFWKLKRYYKIRGRIDLRSNRKVPDVSYFGADEEIYTPMQIMRTSLNNAAMIINEIFRRSVDYPTLSWEHLDDLHRQSKIAAADHMLMKIRLLLDDETITDYSAPIIQKAYQRYCEAKNDEAFKEQYRKLDHLRWLRFYTFYNWTYGSVRNDIKREHPMLCRYDMLTPEQKKERDAAWELLGNLSAEFHLPSF